MACISGRKVPGAIATRCNTEQAKTEKTEKIEKKKNNNVNLIVHNMTTGRRPRRAK